MSEEWPAASHGERRFLSYDHSMSNIIPESARTAPLLIALAVNLFVAVAGIRTSYSSDAIHEYVGTLVSQGVSVTSGDGSTGEPTRSGLVILPDGSKIVAAIKASSDLPGGSKVKVRQYKVRGDQLEFVIVGLAEQTK
jgi:hypothetical protein